MRDAAIRLVVQYGIGGTTLQAIGELAGYSRGLATHRFGSKAGLLAEVLKSAGADWLQRVQEAVGSRIGAEAVSAAVDAQCRFILEAPEEIRAMYLLWFESIDPGAEFRADVSEVHRAQRRDVVAWIKLGQQHGAVDSRVSAERFAEQFSATMAGLVYQWLVNQSLPVRAMHAQLKKDIRLLLARQGERAGARARTDRIRAA
jgi:AcrR family transcriptional regulator